MKARERLQAVIFDLDGVITRTASVHAASWKQTFDAYLQARAAREGTPFEPFDAAEDYLRYVDGRPRDVGVASFLASRGIHLPAGDPADPPDRETVWGLGSRKNELFNAALDREGVDIDRAAVALARRARAGGLKTALVTSSRNAGRILAMAGLRSLFDVCLDGVERARLGKPGKPAPDMFLEAAARLGVPPAAAAILEDAESGVEAARRGGFGFVIGVDRTGRADRLRARGADVVVQDLEELLDSPDRHQHPLALDALDDLVARFAGRRPAVFLDYDGTLSPIVSRPEDAVISPGMRAAVAALAARCPVAIVSGRDREDVQARVGLDRLIYAGSHGFDIAGPAQGALRHSQGEEFLPALDAAERALRDRLADVAGSLVDRKRFSVAIHFRNVAPAGVPAVERAVSEVAAAHPRLRTGHGKKVFELQPRLDWDKGRAVLWLLDALDLTPDRFVPLYIGDDVTDEDAFRALRERGVGLVVMEAPRPSAAQYRLRDTDEVRVFLERLATAIDGSGEAADGSG